MPDDTRLQRVAPKPACPICGKGAEQGWRPFCSRRCADLDLGRWLTGAYAIPVEEEAAPGPETADD